MKREHSACRVLPALVLHGSDSRYFARWCSLCLPPSWTAARLVPWPHHTLISSRTLCFGRPVLSINFKNLSARVRMSRDSHPRFRSAGSPFGWTRALWRCHSIPVCGYRPGGDLLSRWISALRGRLSVLSILPIGCSRMLRASPDHSPQMQPEPTLVCHGGREGTFTWRHLTAATYV